MYMYNIYVSICMCICTVRYLCVYAYTYNAKRDRDWAQILRELVSRRLSSFSTQSFLATFVFFSEHQYLRLHVIVHFLYTVDTLTVMSGVKGDMLASVIWSAF